MAKAGAAPLEWEGMRAPRSLVTALTVSLVLVALAPAARATIMLPLSLEDLTRQSAAVVRARVVDQSAAWDEGHQRIYTRTTLQPIDPIHQTAKLPGQLVVRSLGGEVGEVGMQVAGTPSFTLGEEVLVFLRADPGAPALFQVVGMAQGKYHIEHEAKGRVIAVPSVEGLAFAKPGADGVIRVDPSVPDPTRIPLEELRRRIVEIARGSAAPASGSTLSPAPPATLPARTPAVIPR